MGIRIFNRSSSCGCLTEQAGPGPSEALPGGEALIDKLMKESAVEATDDKPFGTPDPSSYKIINTVEVVGDKKCATVVEVLYPDSKNYEGRKIMVYRNCDAESLRAVTMLDPHFCENEEHLSPFARFEPTEEGWDMAVKLARFLVRK